MNILVCVKRVPDSATRIRIASEGRSIDPGGVKYVINPYDEFALEEALRQKEGAGGGHVTVISLGPDANTESIRQSLAIGADAGVLLRSEGSHDPLVVAQALAGEIRNHDFDLVCFGKQAIDDDHSQVPQMVAELLGLPCASVVVSLEIEGGQGVARREVEGGHEVVRFELPAVISAQKGLNQPRYASLKGIMAAKRKPLEIKEVTLGTPGLNLVELEEPPAPVAGRVVGQGPEAVSELVRLLREEAGVL